MGETVEDILREMQAVCGFVGERYFHSLIGRIRTAHNLDLIKLYVNLTKPKGGDYDGLQVQQEEALQGL